MTPIDPKAAAVPDWFAKYLARGFKLIPYARGEKGPSGVEGQEWPSRCVDSADGYVPGRNWGVLLGTNLARDGESPRYLGDLDFDCDVSRALAKAILPPTDFGFGHGKPFVIVITHGFYTTSEPVASIRFEDPVTGKTFLELRGTKADGTLGLQTMLPPSLHPNGDVLTFPSGGDGNISHDDTLERCVRLLAVATLLAIHLGERGVLHDARLAIAGFLLTEGVTEGELLKLGTALTHYTKNDEKDVALTVRSTMQRLAAGKPVKGEKVLAATLGEHGKTILAKIREWLGGGEWVRAKGHQISRNNEQNIQIALTKLGAKVAYNAFADRLVLDYDGASGLLDDFRRNRLWLDIDKRFHFQPDRNYFDIVLNSVAYEARFHPVLQYLDRLVWDREPRLDTWLITHGKAPDTPYTRAVSSLPLIAAVRRVRRWERPDGVKFDELLILESGQGQFKSSALRALCPDATWFTDDLPLGVDSKQVIERTVGKWIIEASELAGMRRSAVESLKSFCSREKDGPVRLAYDRASTERARQFIIIGTTNAMTGYLKDMTGARRIWPVRIERMDVSGIVRDREQLWAEAAAREAAADSSIRLPEHLWGAAEEQQEQRRLGDPWEDTIAEILDDAHDVDPDVNYIRADVIWIRLGKEGANSRNNQDAERVASIMQRHGFMTKKRLYLTDGTNGDRRRYLSCWLRGEVQQDMLG